MRASTREKLIRLGDIFVLAIGAVLALPPLWIFQNSSSSLTPGQELQAGLPPMPVGWEAGYRSHGEWIQWYRLEQHPLIFIALVCSLLLGVTLVWWKLFQHFTTTGTPDEEYVKKLFR